MTVRASFLWFVNTLLVGFLVVTWSGCRQPKTWEQHRVEEHPTIPARDVYKTSGCWEEELTPPLITYESVVKVFGEFYSLEEFLDIEDAIEVNIHPDEAPMLRPYVYAIGRCENGGPGREFGILVKDADTFRKQAGWCAATVYKNYARWRAGSRLLSYVTYLGNRYCPVGADNDPTGLNVHWETNVRHWVRQWSEHHGH